MEKSRDRERAVYLFCLVQHVLILPYSEITVEFQPMTALHMRAYESNVFPFIKSVNTFLCQRNKELNFGFIMKYMLKKKNVNPNELESGFFLSI